MEFDRKVVVVTGASRGFGKEIARAFGSRGAAVVLNARNAERLNAAVAELNSASIRAIPAQADVSVSEEVNTMIERVVADLGGIDVLVNNAAVFANPIGIADLGDEEWQHVTRTNLDSVFYCSRAVIPHMIRRGGGKIVNHTSFTGKTGRVVYSKVGTPTKAHYCASKAAIISLTKSLAYELAPHHINVNGVAAGSVATDETTAEKRAMLKALVPLGRVGEVEDVSAAVLFLASEGASYITGEILDVNGGTLMD